MPLKELEIQKYSIKIALQNQVLVWVGPCAVKDFIENRIPIDGRKYECGGEITLANGLSLQASFRIQKTDDPLLIQDSIYTRIDDVWYKLAEEDFMNRTELECDDIFPFTWIPDIQLDHPKRGPYDMNWNGE